jgi:hypothetical protein
MTPNTRTVSGWTYFFFEYVMRQIGLPTHMEINPYPKPEGGYAYVTEYLMKTCHKYASIPMGDFVEKMTEVIALALNKPDLLRRQIGEICNSYMNREGDKVSKAIRTIYLIHIVMRVCKHMSVDSGLDPENFLLCVYIICESAAATVPCDIVRPPGTTHTVCVDF